ncbi:lysine--tRNA ligase [Mycoplasma iguanae]|uniref:Lysine--tRNA ligase n=1 Tax=Mycoplasma iguanae TaxID=292461 RepID=A0ABY5RAC3_9MOLU|nr:lysine--tRNA ligase [Mycoplasma iguanae]UVD81712.1 lysine--tRNA ligase [Mycoplasma iguanae]
MIDRKFSEQELVRRDKLAKYKEMNINPFAETEKISDNSKTILEKFDIFSKEELIQKKAEISVAGRIITSRGPFIIIQDLYGKLQLYFNKKEYPKLNELVETFDLGDIIFARGFVMKTNTGQVSLHVDDIKLLTKSLKPLPEKYHGLVDVEERYRRRYLDLLTSEESKNIFISRTKIISFIRKYFDSQDYLEVDTPVLQPILGGASAKPFTTHHNALDMPFYLRIATELPLKKLLVGGLEKVYEIGRIFRNEGVDTTHNPEFTSIEFYEAYSNLESMVQQTENLIKSLAHYLNKTEIEYDNKTIYLNKPFARINMVEATSKAVGVDLKEISLVDAKKIAQKHNIKVEKYFTVGHIINELFEELIEKTLIQPTFVYGHPIEISPLAKNNSLDARFTDRAELFINTKEYANMFTELNDPIDQLKRFEDQLKERESGNDEASEIDLDFIEALEYGMPPAGGCGIGIDRLVMLFTQKMSIREVLLFPHLKNKK